MTPAKVPEQGLKRRLNPWANPIRRSWPVSSSPVFGPVLKQLKGVVRGVSFSDSHWTTLLPKDFELGVLAKQAFAMRVNSRFSVLEKSGKYYLRVTPYPERVPSVAEGVKVNREQAALNPVFIEVLDPAWTAKLRQLFLEAEGNKRVIRYTEEFREG